MNNKINLIVIEGHDKTGGDELMKNLKDDDRFVIYEHQNIDYKDTCDFEQFMIKYVRKVLDDLYTIHRGNPDKIIVMSRFLYADNVFSEIYHRKPIISNYHKREIETNFNIYTIFMFWYNYEKYVKRIKKTNGKIVFSEKELDTIEKLYFKNILNTHYFSNKSYLIVTDKMIPDDVLKWFNNQMKFNIDFYFKNDNM